MYPLYFIAKNNLKKKKSDAVVLIGLIMLAVMMMYISVSVLSNGGSVLDKLHEETNGMHWHLFAEKDRAEGVDEIIEAQEGVAAYEVSDAILVAVAEYYVGDEEPAEYSFIFEDANYEYEIGKINAAKAQELKAGQIILPYYVHVSNGYEVGDIFHLIIGDEEYSYEIADFSEDPAYASPMTVSMYKCFLVESDLEELQKSSGAIPSVDCKVRLDEGIAVDVFEQAVLNDINREVPEISQGQNWSYDWNVARMGNLMMANISMGILLVFAMILLGITLIVIRFSINNFCELNMRNIGVLRASGYTAKQLVGSFVMEMFMLALLGAMLGIVLGAICGDTVGGIVSSMVGVSYAVGFDMQSAAIVLIACIVVVLLITWSCSRKYGKIAVLDALREGIVAHNFRKNHIPLERTKQPLALALGMKSILHAKAKNLGILFIVAMLSFCSCIGFGMYQNFAADISYMMKMVGQEIGDAAYIGEDLDVLGSEIEELPVVEKVNYMSDQDTTIASEDKEVSVLCNMWKEPEKLENKFLLEGRYPEYNNEIMLTNVVCDRLGVALGDTVNVEGTDGSKDYVIVGIDQEINGMGLKAMMNYEGGIRLNGECITKQIYIYGTGELTVQELLNYLNETFPDREAFDIQAGSATVTNVVALAMELICMIFVTVTVVVVVLVVYLLIKAKVIRERKNYGVYKAIGFTTGQLCMQTVLSNLPIMITGALLGVLASIRGAEKVALLGLSTCGIEKCELNVAPIYLAITVAIVVGVAFVVALLTSYRIRKIEPVKMLTEE